MKILVIQLRRLGDIILTTPVLPYLKSIFPQAEIDFLCEPMGKNILESNPHIHELLIYDKNKTFDEIVRIRSRKYDVIFDFMNNPRTSWLSFLSSAKSTVAFYKPFRRFFYTLSAPLMKEPIYVPKEKLTLIDFYLKKNGIVSPKKINYLPHWYLKSEDQNFADQWLQSEKLTSKSYVVMAPIHRHITRQWRIDGFKELALRIYRSHGLPTYLNYGPGEEELLKEMVESSGSIIRFLPQTSICQAAAIFKHAQLLVTNDSGSMHTAVSVGTPTVTIYGSTRPQNWNPSLAEGIGYCPHKIVQADGLDCLGCHLNACPIGLLCMKNLETDKVYQAVLDLLEEKKQ